MKKLVTGSLLLIILAALQTNAFALSLNCVFKEESVGGIKDIKVSDDYLIIDHEIEIPLEKSRVKCGNFGRQTRFDGSALGYQVILKSCSTEAKLEGYLIDSIKEVSADVLCRSI